jgi:RHS repeat-associated protein
VVEPGLADTGFHVFDGWRQVAQHTLHVSGSSFYAVPTKQFVWGARLDEMLAYRRRVVVSGVVSWEVYYVLHGGQDTAARLVDAGGVVRERYEYDPYGMVKVYSGAGSYLGGTSPLGLAFLWKAVRLDAETGLLYMRNRYYSTGLGRFLTRDPIGVWGDGAQMGNELAYGLSSPLSFGDPLGLQAQPGRDLQRFDPEEARFGEAPNERFDALLDQAQFLTWKVITSGKLEYCGYYIDFVVLRKRRWIRSAPAGLPPGRGAENVPDETDDPQLKEGSVLVFNKEINGMVVDLPQVGKYMNVQSFTSLMIHELVHVRQDIDVNVTESVNAAEYEAHTVQLRFLEDLMELGLAGSGSDALGYLRSYAAFIRREVLRYKCK